MIAQAATTGVLNQQYRAATRCSLKPGTDYQTGSTVQLCAAVMNTMSAHVREKLWHKLQLWLNQTSNTVWHCE